MDSTACSVDSEEAKAVTASAGEPDPDALASHGSWRQLSNVTGVNVGRKFLFPAPIAQLRVMWSAISASCVASEQCAENWELYACTADEPVISAVARVRPDVLCFEVHPDDLRAQESIRLARHEHPDLPIVLISEAPSEALALAALRLRIWDLLVKPLAAGQLDETLGRLAVLLARSARRGTLPRMSSQSRRRSTQPGVLFIRDNLHRHLSLAECARICNLSPCEFSRRFRAEHAVSFSEYVLRVRVERAAALLAGPECSVSEIAYSVGFNDLSYFARVFRRFVGMSASLYRQSLAPLPSASAFFGSFATEAGK